MVYRRRCLATHSQEPHRAGHNDHVRDILSRSLQRCLPGHQAGTRVKEQMPTITNCDDARPYRRVACSGRYLAVGEDAPSSLFMKSESARAGPAGMRARRPIPDQSNGPRAGVVAGARPPGLRRPDGGAQPVGPAWDAAPITIKGAFVSATLSCSCVVPVDACPLLCALLSYTVLLTRSFHHSAHNNHPWMPSLTVSAWRYRGITAALLRQL